MDNYQPLDLPRGLRGVMYDNTHVQKFEKFKRAEGKNLSPSYTVETRFQPQQAAYRIPESNTLRTVLSRFEDIDTESNSNLSWDDVLDCIDKARDTNAAKATLNPARSLRRQRDVVRLLDSMVDLIPDEKGLSVLKWGLAFVFQVWINRIDNAERIIRVLDDIPRMLSRTCEIWGSYRKDIQLQIFVIDYFDVILQSLTKLLSRLLKAHVETNKKAESKLKAIQEGTKSVAKKINNTVKEIGGQVINADSAVIDEIVANLDEKRQIVSDRVEVLDRERAADTNKTTHEGVRESKAIRVTVNEINYTVGNIPNHLKTIGDNITKEIGKGRDLSGTDKEYIQQVIEQQMDMRNADLLQQIRKEFGMHRRGVVRFMPMSCAEMIQTGLYGIISEDEYKRQELGWYDMAELPVPGCSQQNQLPPAALLSHRPVVLTIEDLLDVLEIDAEFSKLSVKDERSILQQAYAMRPDALGHASGLMAMPKFKNWLAIPGSQVLMVDGHCVDMAIGRTSPLSVFCASLAASLALAQPFVVLDYFCGYHSHVRDRHGGPQGLMRSLIGQLLLYPDKPDPSLGFMEEALHDGLRIRDPLALCRLFEELLQQIDRSKTVFCIIDNIVDFESHGQAREINTVVDNLLRITDSYDQFPPLKLLMTSSSRSRLTKKVKESEHVSLIARGGNSRPLLGRGFTQDVQQLMSRTALGNNSQLLPERPRMVDRAVMWAGNNRSYSNLQDSAQPGSYDSLEIQRSKSSSSLR